MFVKTFKTLLLLVIMYGEMKNSWNIYLVHCNLNHYALKVPFTKCSWLHIKNLSNGGSVNIPTISYSFYYFIYAQFKFHFQKHHCLFFAGLSSLLTTSLLWLPSSVVRHAYQWETRKQYNTLSCLCVSWRTDAQLLCTHWLADLHTEELAAKSILYLHSYYIMMTKIWIVSWGTSI